MPRRKKGLLEEDEPKAAPAGVALEDNPKGDPDGPDDEEREEDEEQDEEADEKPAGKPVDPSEVEGLEKLSTDEQETVLKGMEQEGKDTSIIRARINQGRRKKWQHIATVTRLQPLRAPDGSKCSGLLERFDAPFTDLDIKDHIRKFFKGGTYDIVYHDVAGMVGYHEK
ncbi:MAG: hypothetical protein ACRD3M_16110, partial [Thermoanaerobaculia bacterium]